MAIEDAPVVKVLDFDEAEAYNPNRPISGLIRNQLLHLHHAENLVVPLQSRTNININNLLTERQASDYIHKVTQLLHRYGKSDRAGKPAKKRPGQAKAGTKSAKKPTPLKKAIKKTQSSAQKVDRKQAKKTTRNKSKSR